MGINSPGGWELGSGRCLDLCVLEGSSSCLPAPCQDSFAATKHAHWESMMWPGAPQRAATQQMLCCKGTVPQICTPWCILLASVPIPGGNKSSLPAGFSVPSRMMHLQPCCCCSCHPKDHGTVFPGLFQGGQYTHAPS